MYTLLPLTIRFFLLAQKKKRNMTLWVDGVAVEDTRMGIGSARKWKNYYSFPVQRHARRRRVDDDERDNINMRRRVGVVRTGDIYSTLEY